MSLQRGYVQSIEARNDGWVEVVILALNAGNTRHTYFVPSLDGDLSKAHQRLTQVSLMRDALARSCPVELQYTTDEKQGALIQEVTIYTHTSLDGRAAAYWVEGVVVSVTIQERDATSNTTPYLDTPDFANIVLLRSSGTLESYILDLQRAEPDTGHRMLTLLVDAERTRRAISVQVATTRAQKDGAIIVGVRKQQVVHDDLQTVVVFLERMGARPESYQADTAEAQNQLWIKYTTAPDQVPEGNLSENGSFQPTSGQAWLHQDSPLVTRLAEALRGELQVKLELAGDVIHGAEVVAGLGSVARPVWLTFHGRSVPSEAGLCVNQPTITPPGTSALNAIPHGLSLEGQAYFGKGIWRFIAVSESDVTVLVDGKEIGCGATSQKLSGETVGEKVSHESRVGKAEAPPSEVLRGVTNSSVRVANKIMAHLFLEGVHTVEFRLSDHSCASKFISNVYRIR